MRFCPSPVHHLRPSHCPNKENEQRETHADVSTNKSPCTTPIKCKPQRRGRIDDVCDIKGNIYIRHPMSIYRCNVLTLFLEVAKFQVVKNKASSKRFPKHSDSPFPPVFLRLSDRGLLSGSARVVVLLPLDGITALRAVGLMRVAANIRNNSDNATTEVIFILGSSGI